MKCDTYSFSSVLTSFFNDIPLQRKTVNIKVAPYNQLAIVPVPLPLGT